MKEVHSLPKKGEPTALCLGEGDSLGRYNPSPESPKRPEGRTHHGSRSAPLPPPGERFIPLCASTTKQRRLRYRYKPPRHGRPGKYGSGGRKPGRETVVKGDSRREGKGGEHDFGLVDGWADHLPTGLKGGASRCFALCSLAEGIRKFLRGRVLV
ncbi:hypothetical protein Cadr_000000462 [Camelus dromedarius]|uniref:Uncharacterized protein n=1 Tax=Camelus dromedarius TaxID=9838 RepID=A0A5N4EKI9_CAMDR|nr:hypothetical protein Cadr_000000462 [Camelus dromedarius]